MPRPGIARQRLLLLVAGLSMTALLPYAWHVTLQPGSGDLDWGQAAQLPEEPFVEISAGSDSETHASVVAILSQHCFQCHGPDPATRKAGLRLDTFEGTRAQTRQGAPVVPGDPKHSRLLVRIDDADAPMPPEPHPRLTDTEKEILRAWIAAGAPQPRHWAFVAPQRFAAPAVQNRTWGRNFIDSFVLARLEREGLEPSPEADRRTLVRRVSIDLTGLPPSPAEVQAFVADQRPDAYERLVDCLLSSSRFGEHFARGWLDVARYGDTHGLHLDNYREIWPYRDWVIRAFNDNMSYDRFLIEQLAGDILPDASTLTRVATGFLRSQASTGDIDSIPEDEARFAASTGMAETTATAIMGLTLTCARCHDHKYDPLTQHDYYRFYSFFNSNDGPSHDLGAAYPYPAITTASQGELLKDYFLHVRMTELEQRMSEGAAPFVADKAIGSAPNPGLQQRDYVWVDDEPKKADYVRFEAPPEHCHFAEGPKYPVLSGKQSLRMTGNGHMLLWITKLRPTLIVGPGDSLFAYVWVDPERPPHQIVLEWLTTGWDHRAFWGENVIVEGKLGTASRRYMGPIPKAGGWVRLEVPAEHVGLEPGREVTGVGLRQIQGGVFWDRIGIRTSTGQGREEFASFAEWLALQELQRGLHLPGPLREAVVRAPDQRTAEDVRRLREHFVIHFCPETKSHFASLVAEHRSAAQEQETLREKMPRTLVFQEMASPKPAFIHERGEWDRPGEPVTRGVPAVILPFAMEESANRLDLCRWLLDRAHPLTARVAVNRLWQQVFGVGLVRTPEDFGIRGERPEYAELLDRLAVDFRLSGWDVKRLVRSFVLSATYRQAATVRSDLAQRDPDNRLLARSLRRRFDAEILRDQALAIGGLLVERVGGPSVKPPQPPGLWEMVSVGTSNTRTHIADTLPERIYRRSMYTFWKRTSPPPQMGLLDAPSRETCVCRREQTNTPLQALLLLNEPQFVQAARGLARRATTQTGLEAQLRFMLGLATSRPPTDRELNELRISYKEHERHFANHPEAVRSLLPNGDGTPAMAALLVTASTVLNLDEVLNRP